MSYKKYSPINIGTNFSQEKLSISLEPGNPKFEENDQVVLLYIPRTDNFEHYHISLTDKGLQDLYNWLMDYLEN